MLMPFVALLIQFKIWSFIQPFGWYLFYPALILSTWIGGFVSGVVATFTSAILVWYFFVPDPANEPKYIYATTLFIFLGLLFSALNSRLRKVMRLRREAETALRIQSEQYKESETKFRGLLDTAYDSIIIVNSKGEIEFANQQTEQWLGYKPEELVGKPVELIIPERFKTSHLAHRERYMMNPSKKSMGRNLQLFAKKKDGTDLAVDISLSVFQSNGDPVITAFIRDVSDKKRVEAQQRFLLDTTDSLSGTIEYEQRIQRITSILVPSLADCCLVHLLENDKFVLKASIGKKETNLEPIKEICNQKFFTKNVWQGNSDFVVKYGVVQPTGLAVEALPEEMTKLKVQSWVSVPLKAHAALIGTISFIRFEPLYYSDKDVDFFNLVADRAAIALDNARLYKEAQKAVRLREDVLAIVSHDLKNPLGVIKGLNEVIGERLLENGERLSYEFTESIASSVRQMERLVGDLLDFAKIQSGTLSIQSSPQCMDDLIKESIENVRHHANKKQIRFLVNSAQNIPLVDCDPDRIRQVLTNILGNAIKFSPDQSVIKLETVLKLSEIEVAVTDSGQGIPAENLPHLFDRYWQAKETSKLGTGLGLSIAKGIIESHSGRIWAESTKGAGTTLLFTLPLPKSKIIFHSKKKNNVQSDFENSIHFYKESYKWQPTY